MIAQNHHPSPLWASLKNSSSGATIALHLLGCCLALVICGCLWNTLIKCLLNSNVIASQHEQSTLRAIECLLLIILWPPRELSIKKALLRASQNLFIGLGIAGVGLLSFHGLHLLLNTWGENQLWSAFRNPSPRETWWAFFPFAVIFGPLLEELFFRRTFWLHFDLSHKSTALKLQVGFWSTLLFAMLHLSWDLSLTAQVPLLIMWTACGSLSFALYWWRRSSITPWVVHACANAVLLWPEA